jgi:hypothetical protein
VVVPDVFRKGEFKLHSGSVSRWKIDMDGCTDGDWEALALMLAERLPPFREVSGVPRGGLKLAQALSDYTDGSAQHPILVVDDVFTTGASMEDHRRLVAAGWQVGPSSVIGAVAFARGPCPAWVTPLFSTGPNPWVLEQTARELEAEVRSLQAELARLDPKRCPAHPKGERCCLPAGHPGGHRWAGGD